MVGIKDVAEAAGVSTATVSRVLSNGLHVRPEVRKRVMAEVERLGYRPNLVARSLRAQQSNTIGLIVSDISNPFFTALSRAVEDTAYEQGFSVLLCNTDEDPEKEAIYLNLMRDTSVAGAIMSPTRQTIANFADSNLPFPIVIVDRSVSNSDVDAVLLDNVDALAPKTEYMKNIPPKVDAGYAATLKMIDLGEPPDALFTVNSLIAVGALQAIRERNLTIPDDIALVTFDETTWASLVQPAITLIAQPTYEIGKTAAELLLQRVADPGRPTRQVILKGQLCVRGSSAPRLHPVG